jgi:hypothetical protein
MRSRAVAASTDDARGTSKFPSGMVGVGLGDGVPLVVGEGDGEAGVAADGDVGAPVVTPAALPPDTRLRMNRMPRARIAAPPITIARTAQGIRRVGFTVPP